MILNNTTIGFIGAGNMASALLEGLLAQGIPPSQLWATDSQPNVLEKLSLSGINISLSKSELVKACDILVLAVKPQVINHVLSELSPLLEKKPCLLISIAAGIQLETLATVTTPTQAIVRTMPNTPALVLEGATGMVANAASSAEQREQAHALMSAVGKALWLEDESQLDLVTALSGSGPAYFFLLIESLIDAAVKKGLNPETATTLCLQTALGSAKLASTSELDAAELRRRVTSPGGTTEAALEVFEKGDLRVLVDAAVTRAVERCKELALN
jgi:pyrroline-5-carboxylate reductase